MARLLHSPCDTRLKISRQAHKLFRPPGSVEEGNRLLDGRLNIGRSAYSHFLLGTTFNRLSGKRGAWRGLSVILQLLKFFSYKSCGS